MTLVHLLFTAAIMLAILGVSLGLYVMLSKFFVNSRYAFKEYRSKWMNYGPAGLLFLAGVCFGLAKWMY